MRKIVLLLLPLAAAGCVHTVATVVTAPVRATAKVVDWTTTSPSERDRDWVRRHRKAEEREAKERHDWAKHCAHHPDRDGCDAYHGFLASSVR